jgi:hypothetical protein
MAEPKRGLQTTHVLNCSFYLRLGVAASLTSVGFFFGMAVFHEEVDWYSLRRNLVEFSPVWWRDIGTMYKLLLRMPMRSFC